MLLLKALQDIGFDLPIRLLAGRPELLVSEVDGWFVKLKPIEDNAAINLTNALLNLLWAFELRATASWVYQLAMQDENRASSGQRSLSQNVVEGLTVLLRFGAKRLSVLTRINELIDGCFIRRGLVPAFNHIKDRLGGFVSPKKFSRLALLPDEMRERVIKTDIEGHRQKLEKKKKKKKIKGNEMNGVNTPE